MQKAGFTVTAFTVQDREGNNIPSPKGEDVWTAEDVQFSTVTLQSGKRLALKEKLLYALGIQGQVEPEPTPVTVETPGTEINATKNARAKAAELGVNLEDIEGTGTDGRITVDDVKAAAEATEPSEEELEQVEQAEEAA